MPIGVCLAIATLVVIACAFLVQSCALVIAVVTVRGRAVATAAVKLAVLVGVTTLLALYLAPQADEILAALT